MVTLNAIGEVPISMLFTKLILKSFFVLEIFTIKDGGNDRFGGQNRPKNGSFWLINPQIFHLVV